MTQNEALNEARWVVAKHDCQELGHDWDSYRAVGLLTQALDSFKD